MLSNIGRFDVCVKVHSCDMVMYCKIKH